MNNVNKLEEDALGKDLNIKIRTQPPQSPDTNILDLGLFASMKKRGKHLKSRANTLQQLINNVNTVYNEYDHQTLHKIWCSYFNCLNEILKRDGDTNYKPPRDNNKKYRKNNPFFIDLQVKNEVHN